MGRENRRIETDLGAADALPESELAAFLSTLSQEEQLRVDVSDPDLIVINTRDGRLIDKIPRARTIMATGEDEAGKPINFPVDTLEHITNLLNLPEKK